MAGIEDEEEDGKVYKRWKIGNIGYNVGQQGLKWQQIGNTIGNKRQHGGNSESFRMVSVLTGRWKHPP